MAAPISIAATDVPTGNVPRVLRILVADDQDVNQLVACRFLQKLGYQPDRASNGLDVLSALAQRPYDVVFMDCHMPELDGYAATARICQLYPPSQRPKIVAMTASTLPEDREHCRRAGMDAFLSKPIRMDQLAGTLHALFPDEALPRPSTVENPPAA